MTHASDAETGGPEQIDDAARLRRLAQDWLALWQDELLAIAQDPDTMRSWQAMLNLWASAAAAAPRGTAHDDTARNPPTALPDDPSPESPQGSPGPTPVAAAPDPRDTEIEHLRGQLRDVESRLAELERSNRSRRPRAGLPAVRVAPRRPA